MTVSKTKASGRVDMNIRMAPELKLRVVAAAKEAGIPQTDWVLRAIEASLAIQDAEARQRAEIEALEHLQDMKFEEIVALLALKNRLGDLASLSREKRKQFDDEAEIRLDKWREKEAMDHLAKPATDLERLCKEYEDLGSKILRLERDHHPLQRQSVVSAFGDDEFDDDESDDDESGHDEFDDDESDDDEEDAAE